MTRAIAATEPDVEPPAGLDRLRVLASAAMGTVLVSYAMLVPTTVALVHTGGRGVSLDGAFAAAVPLWLAAHQVPLVVQGQPLSVLPLLPTAAVLAVVAMGSTWAVRRLGGRAGHDGGAVLATVGGAHPTVAVLATALLPPEVAAGTWTALLAAALVAIPAAGLGVLRACGVRELAARWRPLPRWVGPGVRGALVGLASLAVVGALALLGGLVAAAGNVHTAYEQLAPNAAAGVGVTILAFLYLPNAVIAGVSWAYGAGVGVGAGWASPFAAVPGEETSSFPLLAAMPSHTPVWAVAVLLVPVAVGVLVGRACVRFAGPVPPAQRVCSVLLAVGVTALAAGLFGLVAGGRLAAGAYDPVHVPALWLLLAVLVWTGLPAVAAATLQMPERASGRAVAAIRARREAARAAQVGDTRPAGGASDPAAGASPAADAVAGATADPADPAGSADGATADPTGSADGADPTGSADGAGSDGATDGAAGSTADPTGSADGAEPARSADGAGSVGSADGADGATADGSSGNSARPADSTAGATGDGSAEDRAGSADGSSGNRTRSGGGATRTPDPGPPAAAGTDPGSRPRPRTVADLVAERAATRDRR